MATTRIKRTERRGEFRARDVHGQWHTVVVFQQIIDVSNVLNPKAEMLGPKILQTPDGRPVDHVDKGVYEVVGVPRIRMATDDAP